MNTETTSDLANPMIEMDAHEFGMHLKQGGWRLGLLVARSVEPGVGDRSVSRGERSASIEGKVSAKQFAADAGTSDTRVLRYYRAWERAADKGKVPSASDLAPGDEPDIDWELLPRWKKYFNPVAWDGGATGPLNLTVKLGQYGERFFRSHKRFITFVIKELPEDKPGKPTRELAGRYAACLETEAGLLRRIEANEPLPEKAELEELLDSTKFFETAR